MVRPQNEDLNRSGNTPLDPDSVGGRLDARDQPGSDDRTGGPVPPENRPGHHPDVEQDQPDADAFVARFSGHDTDADSDTGLDDTRDRAVSSAKAAFAGASRAARSFAASTVRVAQATGQAIRDEIDGRRADR